mmetsp:Transcript_22543/g.62545  ORF Transcript_22543/g.62545 Transcript_22543/m.62545 type:complete len:442 (-) Transcript_22543:354-1679(-)|eukprot:CAMPEP_0117681886 /NCGR_PEP_ID=MMETSP0804-20121206/19272_1 /TAXON_ID=1074897 /ORGANISM="Tetraselmis astigmatica, Strain CCMP880" /LENGTH=441 /DNA_ID=CAMNT_0005491775 /DNA_START=233 /DNA_END=1558 /DNA_ORIENTATION=-
MAYGCITPPDRFHVAYFCYFFMGLGLLMPWNSFITAIDYFSALYPDRRVDTMIAVAYNIPNLMAMVSMLPFSKGTGSQLRILAGYWLFLIGTTAVPLVDVIFLGGDSQGTQATFTMTLLLAAVLGLADGIAQSSLFGEAGCLPAKYTQAVCAGTSMSGLFVSILRVTTKAAMPAALRTSAFVYFGMSGLFTIICIFLATAVIPSLPVVRAFVNRGKRKSSIPSTPEESSLSHSLPSGAPPVNVSANEIELAATDATMLGASLELDDDDVLLLGLAGAPAKACNCRPGVVWHIKLEAASLVLTYWVTITIFPGFLADDQHSAELGDWYPVLLITAYNLGDLLGKLGPLLLTVPTAALLPLSAARLAFIPSFYFTSAWMAPPVVIGLLTLALGGTNGHLTACAMMSAPRGLPQPKAEQAGMLSALFLVSGIVLGSCTGLLWQL